MRRSAAPSQKGKGKAKTSTITSTSQEPAPSSSSAANAGKHNTSSIMNVLQNPETNQNSPQVSTDEKLQLSPTNRLPTVNVPPLKPAVIRSAYTVLWAKKSIRKHKRWEGDGILEVIGRCGLVKNEDGTRIGQMSNLQPDRIVPGLILSAGKVEIQIKDLIPAGSKKVISVKRIFTEPTPSAMRLVPQDPYMRQGGLVNLLVMPKPTKEHQWAYNTNKARVNEVTVAYCLAKVLRPHQKLGVVFLYGCVTGIKQINRCGAILADEMGMGKTLQCITLIWTLMHQGPYGGIPLVKKTLIVTPSSLTVTWEKEFYRWLGRSRIRIFSAHARKESEFSSTPHPVFIISYEMFVRHFEEVSKLSFDLMICDEGHRLKNSVNKAPTLLNELPCKRRIILTGTPVQNDLLEFYSLVDFVNPGCLGTREDYTNYFVGPILESREPNASEQVKELGAARSKEIHKITSDFILRRTQGVLGAYLPTKTEAVVFCKSTPLQQRLYAAAVEAWHKRHTFKKGMSHLSVFTMLKKICNHPSLIVRDLTGPNVGFPGSLTAFMSTAGGMKLEESGKVKVLLSLLRCVAANEEKIVIVSSYTQTLGMLANLCDVKDYKYVRLDGSVPASNRDPIVTSFNSPWSKTLVFLLSAKAGGVGLNLSGASRLVLFDSDWNPAVDLQAMSRIWRDGQKCSVYLYRFLTTGTLEEKIYQRQISKTELSGTVVDPASTSSIRLSEVDLKDLFQYQFDDDCPTHTLLNCQCKCDGSVPDYVTVKEEEPDRDDQLDLTKTTECSRVLRMNQLMKWEHHKLPYDGKNMDALLLSDAYPDISFMFRNRSKF